MPVSDFSLVRRVCQAINGCWGNILVTSLEWGNGAEPLFAYNTAVMCK